jgi:predicted aspartyl protease
MGTLRNGVEQLKAEDGQVGRIVTSVRVTNAKDPSKSLLCDAMVYTGASYMVLPRAWKERLGEFETEDTVELETATQDVVQGEVCGPVQIKLEGFRAIYNEVLFVDMVPADGAYEPLVGYIILEQSQAAVDMVGHRLIHVKRMDLK